MKKQKKVYSKMQFVAAVANLTSLFIIFTGAILTLFVFKITKEGDTHLFIAWVFHPIKLGPGYWILLFLGVIELAVLSWMSLGFFVQSLIDIRKNKKEIIETANIMGFEKSNGDYNYITCFIVPLGIILFIIFLTASAISIFKEKTRNI